MGQILNCINLNGIENHSNSDTQNIQYSNASGIQMFGIGYAEIFYFIYSLKNVENRTARQSYWIDKYLAFSRPGRY